MKIIPEQTLPSPSTARLPAPGPQRTRRRRRPTGEPPPLPRHLQISGVGWLVAAVLLIGLVIVVFAGGTRGLAVDITVADDAVVSWLGGLNIPGLIVVMQVLAMLSSWWVLKALSVGLIVALLAFRRFRHLIVYAILSGVLSLITTDVLGAIAQRPRPFGAPIRTSWGGWALPPLQLTTLAFLMVVILYTLVPEGRWRNVGKLAATGLIALTALGRVVLGAEAPTDVLVGVAIGVTLPLLAFRWFTPTSVFPISYRRGRAAHLDVGGPRGLAIHQGLQDQLGLVVEKVKPFGLAGSGGSTPLRLTVKGDPPTYLFAKLYARGHLRADRWYKLGRELLYGRLEDEKPFNTVRRLVQQEDYALSLMQRAGLPSPTPYGFVELTPDREYLLVTEFFDGAVELGEAEVDDQVIDDGLSIIRKLWEAGLAHRDVKPANLLVRDHRMLLIDVAFVEARPSPWRQAVDLANMMLCLGLRSNAERVYQRALIQFTVEEISEGFAAARGLALPSQLRRLLREQGRNLHDEFIRLLPSAPQPIPIQRWSFRRVGLMVAMLALLAVVGLALAGSLTDNVATKTPLQIDSLGCTHLEPLWLQAQAVPSASLVPCVRSLPTGWTVANVFVNDGRSAISLDNDRSGPGAMVVRLSATCDPAGATPITSDQPDVRRYQRSESRPATFASTRFDVFPGGCVTTRLSAPTARAAAVATEAPRILGFTSRETLQQELEQRSGGRLHLDPREAP